MNQKAQVSLEYILITLAIVVVLSLIVIQATSLYSRNIKSIDNRAIKEAYEKIQANIDISEILENYTEEITLMPEREWNFEKINNNRYKIFNEDREYTLESINEITFYFTTIKEETKIIFKKENKKITIEKK